MSTTHDYVISVSCRIGMEGCERISTYSAQKNPNLHSSSLLYLVLEKLTP